MEAPAPITVKAPRGAKKENEKLLAGGLTRNRCQAANHSEVGSVMSGSSFFDCIVLLL